MEGQTSCELPHSLNNLGKKGCKYISKVVICTPKTQRISNLHAMMTNQYSIFTYTNVHLTSIHIYSSKNTQQETTCHFLSHRQRGFPRLLLTASREFATCSCIAHEKDLPITASAVLKPRFLIDFYWMPRDWESSWRAWLDVQPPPNIGRFHRDMGALTWIKYLDSPIARTFYMLMYVSVVFIHFDIEYYKHHGCTGSRYTQIFEASQPSFVWRSWPLCHLVTLPWA